MQQVLEHGIEGGGGPTNFVEGPTGDFQNTRPVVIDNDMVRSGVNLSWFAPHSTDLLVMGMAPQAEAHYVPRMIYMDLSWELEPILQFCNRHAALIVVVQSYPLYCNPDYCNIRIIATILAQNISSLVFSISI